jgi:hypothetical protein
VEHAADLRAQAEKIRLEAAKMDAVLTLNKIEILERRLNDKKWLERHEDQRELLMKQLEDLNKRLLGEQTAVMKLPQIEGHQKLVETPKNGTPKNSFPQASSSWRTYSSVESTLVNRNEEYLRNNPLEGFNEEDLRLFLPVAQAIQDEMPKATAEEQLARFREAPELQHHFKKKIQELLVTPMEDMQELENLKEQYLESSSSVEKDTLKRQIDRIEAQMDSPSIANSFFRDIKPMSRDEMELRIENLEKLPRLMQAMFMRRNGVLDGIDLELGVLMEHYDEQLQLLDQVRYAKPLAEDDRMDAVKGYESLPARLQTYFKESLSLDESASSEQVVDALAQNDSFLSTTPMRIVEAGTLEDLPEYYDIEFVERSQYVEELLPSLLDLEGIRPTQEEIDYFVTDILDPKTFGLRSKPERVFGGYYVRGFNKLEGTCANDKLVASLNERLAASELAGRLQFFLIPDPKTLTDEEIDMAVEEEPILVVTGVDPDLLYRRTGIATKVGVTISGLLMLLVFSLGTCELNEIAMSRVQDAARAESLEEIAHLGSNAVPVGVSLAATQLVHEAAHIFVAWKDKVGSGQ